MSILDVLLDCQHEYLNGEQTEESILEKERDGCGINVDLLLSGKNTANASQDASLCLTGETCNQYWERLHLKSLKIKQLPVATIGDATTIKFLFVDFILKHNAPFFANFANKNSTVWNVDGVCATGKSSLRSDMQKSNKYLSLTSHNTHPSNAIGYIFSSLKMMKSSESSQVWDRMFWNNYLWYFIWLAVADAYLDTDEFYDWHHPSNIPTADLARLELSNTKLDLWKAVFEAMHPGVVKYLCDSVGFPHNILVVDSNEKGVYDRLRRRAEGSDVLRSNWPFYVRLQNFFYASLYERYPSAFCVIDLAWFDGDQQLMQDTICAIIEKQDSIPYFPTRATKPPPPTESLFAELRTQSPKTTLRESESSKERFRPLQTLLFSEGSKQLDVLFH